MISRPLKTPWFHILLALSRRDLHGYGIQRAVLDQTDDDVRLWPASLYRALGTLEEAGLIRRVPTPENEPDDDRRQYYRLTAEGRTRLEEEAERMARWAAAAGKSAAPGGPEPA